MPVHYHHGKFPPEEHLDWKRLIPLLGPTAGAIARYDGELSVIPNPEILLSSLSTQEAVMSSLIEGTQTTIGEVLEFQAGRLPESPERRKDIHEVLNYRRALSDAERQLREVPLSQRVVKAAHATLMTGVRGEGKAPGEYRRIQNLIGPPGSTINSARFVPIAANEIVDAMSNWEKYLHNSHPVDRLVQIAILHVEFEAIHPFLDGNGRLGRMLVPLLLWKFGLIRAPVFYISAYLETHREVYYDRMLTVSRDDDWSSWIAFFLNAMQTQAETNSEKTRKVIKLYEEMKLKVAQVTRSRHAIRALDTMFEIPIFNSGNFADISGIPRATAKRIVGVLNEEDVLRMVFPARGSRPGVYIFPALLNIVEGREVF